MTDHLHMEVEGKIHLIQKSSDSGFWTTDWTRLSVTYHVPKRSRAWNKTDPFSGRWWLTIRIGIFERALERSNLDSFWPTIDPVDKIPNRLRYNWVSFPLCHNQVTSLSNRVTWLCHIFLFKFEMTRVVMKLRNKIKWFALRRFQLF